jgi:uncharacterized membrane protein
MFENWDKLRWAIPIVVFLVLLGVGLGKEVKRDPNTGMIRVMYIGSPFTTFCPYPFFRSDPLLSTTPVSAMAWLPKEIVTRALRLYLPRTRKEYSKYDVVGLDDASFEHFPPNTLIWMRDSVTEDGLGFFMGGGAGSFGGASAFPSYAGTPLQDVMPVECLTQTVGFSVNRVVNFDDEFIKSVPWEEFENHNVFGMYNVVKLKDGATKLSEMTAMTGGRTDPGWTWWDIGKGRFFASPTGFRGTLGGGTTSAGVSFMYWKHYPDFVANMAYFLAGLTPPSDTLLLYTTRLKFREVDYHRQMTTGTMEFISRFGAHSGKVDEKLGEAEVVLTEARGFFVDLDLARSLEKAEQVISLLKEADNLALKAKQAALFWVYVIEWFVVTATFLVCGSVLWALMVRRRLYREVSATRIGPA